ALKFVLVFLHIVLRSVGSEQQADHDACEQMAHHKPPHVNGTIRPELSGAIPLEGSFTALWPPDRVRADCTLSYKILCINTTYDGVLWSFSFLGSASSSFLVGSRMKVPLPLPRTSSTISILSPLKLILHFLTWSFPTFFPPVSPDLAIQVPWIASLSGFVLPVSSPARLCTADRPTMLPTATRASQNLCGNLRSIMDIACYLLLRHMLRP